MKIFGKIIFLVILFSINNKVLFAEDRISVFPTPFRVVYKNFDSVIDSKWAVRIDKNNRDCKMLAEYLKEKLIENFDLVMPIHDSGVQRPDKSIVLGTLKNDLIREAIGSKKIDMTDLTDEEGYILEVSDDSIFIIGLEPRGVFWGIQTLLQLITKKNGTLFIPGVEINDKPAVRGRGVDIFSIDLDKAKSILEQMAKYKMNIAIIHSGKYFELDDPDTRRNFEDIFSYARKLYIEPIPELQSFGVSADILNKDPNAAEGIWVQDEHCKFVDNGIVQITPKTGFLTNVIRAEDSDIVIKSLNGERIYKEGVDYYVEGGDISYPYSISDKPTKIYRISNGSIQNGEEILISYDYVAIMAPDTPWSVPYCPSSERTYKVMFNALQDVVYGLSPNFISIGHDEIKGINRDSRCRKRGFSNAELLAEDINKLNDYVKSLNPNIRLLMWDDMLNPLHNGGDETYQVKYGGVQGKTCDAINLLPKDTIFMIWWYDKKEPFNKLRNSSSYFSEKGFEYFIAGWKNRDAISNWLKITAVDKNFLGVIATTWDGWKANLKDVKDIAEIAWSY